MANFNRVVLVGRLTRDPEIRVTNSGVKVAGIGFAVSNSKKDQSGQWVDDPMFIDITAFDRASDGKGLASTFEKFCKKGSQILIEGKLTLDSWNDAKDGTKRTKHKIIADSIQLLDSRSSGPGGGDTGDDMDAMPAPQARGQSSNQSSNQSGGQSRAVSRPPAPPQRPASRPPARQYDEPVEEGQADDIPF